MPDASEARVREALNAVAGPVPVAAAEVSRVAARLRALGVRAALSGEPGYPAALRALARPPRVWFARGADPPPPERAVAIVGARAATPYGRAMASRLAGDLARLGYTIVSGLARGIDAAAHEAALAAGGVTVAVVPGGLDTIVPAHHRPLAARIVQRGAVCSERASGPPLHRWEFVERNRLIAALAGAIVVVEAAERSGALTTAAAARRLGRPVLAVPGDADREGMQGVMALLRDGARACTSAADVVRALAQAAPPPHAGGARPAARRPRLRRAVDVAHAAARPVAPAEARSFDVGDARPACGSAAERARAALGVSPEPLEALAARTALAPGELLAHLLRLEWAGIAVRRPGPRWARAGGAGA